MRGPKSRQVSRASTPAKESPSTQAMVKGHRPRLQGKGVNLPTKVIRGRDKVTKVRVVGKIKEMDRATVETRGRTRIKARMSNSKFLER